jgi:uncharacterized protein with PIN domain
MTPEELVQTKHHFQKLQGALQRDINDMTQGSPSRIQRLIVLHRRTEATLHRIYDEFERRARASRSGGY